MRRRRLAWAGVAATIAALGLAAPALGRSSDIVDADVRLRLAPDASLLVSERLTFDYQGSVRGLLPRHQPAPRRANHRCSRERGWAQLRAGRQHGARQPRPPRGLRRRSRAGRGARIVWHYRATDQDRTFTVSYRVIGGAVAYDDVIDVGWAVWGDQWEFDLERLSASLANPRSTRQIRSIASGATRATSRARRCGARASRRSRPPTFPTTPWSRCGSRVPRRPGQDLSGARVARRRRAARDPRRRAGARRRLQLALQPGSSAGSRITHCCSPSC